MNEQRDMLGILNLMDAPAFCVKEHTIIRANPAAQRMLLAPGTDVTTLLAAGADIYADYCGGCLYLTLNIADTLHDAFVTRVDDLDIFTLENPVDKELAVLALAAQELREPMNGLILSSQKLFSSAGSEEAAKMNRNLYRMMRILGNMTDAGTCQNPSRKETVNIFRHVQEIAQKAAAFLEKSDIHLQSNIIDEDIYCLADCQQLERAILNILSNASRYTSKGGTIKLDMRRTGRTIQLRIQDSGPGMDPQMLPTIFTRYLRQVSVEDGRSGIGLGMLLVRAAARNHDGTVLIDQPQEGGLRITLTMTIQQSQENRLLSPVFRTDYAGGWDHTLLEFSDLLDIDLFDPN